MQSDWDFIERVLRSRRVRVVYLYGPPGIGKTYAAYNSGRVDKGVFPVTLTQETPASELTGHYVPRGQELAWHDGPFTRALRAGGRLVINEISHASPDVLAILYPVLESEATAQLMLPTGEIVRPEQGFHCVITDNHGPENLPAALQDRFDCEIQIERPHPDALKLLPPELRRAAERTFALERDRRITLRKWQKLADLYGEFTAEEACRAVFGPERGAQILEGLNLADARSEKPAKKGDRE